MAHPAGTPSASRSLGPGVGDVPAVGGSSPGGAVLEGGSAVRSRARCFPQGWRADPHTSGTGRGHRGTPASVPCSGTTARHPARSGCAMRSTERRSATRRGPLLSPMTRSRTRSGTVRRRPILQSYSYGSRQWQGAFPLPPTGQTIRRFIDAWNERCEPFVWTRDAADVIAKANRPTTSVTRH
jgi:hypothetical protein